MEDWNESQWLNFMKERHRHPVLLFMLKAVLENEKNFRCCKTMHLSSAFYTFQTYIDLSEVLMYTNLECFFIEPDIEGHSSNCPEVQGKFYIASKERGKTTLYFTVPTSQKISYKFLRTLQKCILEHYQLHITRSIDPNLEFVIGLRGVEATTVFLKIGKGVTPKEIVPSRHKLRQRGLFRKQLNKRKQQLWKQAWSRPKPPRNFN